MEVDPKVMQSHAQLDEFSCIPMSIQYVLKILGLIPSDSFVLQREWNNKKTGSFADFHEKEIAGLHFRHQFSFPRNEAFPLADLFRTIDAELAAGHLVIVSLSMPGGWHNFVVHQPLPNGEYRAVSKLLGQRDLIEEHVRDKVCLMKGTDILTYEFVGDAHLDSLLTPGG